MTDSLQDFLEELAEAGDTQGTGAGFTLRSDKAREKLKKFALAHPENYFLLVIAGLHALGGRRFSLRVDADDLQVRADCRIEPQRLANLWESVAGGKEEIENSGLRLLGLAILTSVRFGRVDWTIDSGDGESYHRFRQKVSGEELADPLFEPLSQGEEGTVVSVKRKDMKTVASRFFSQLTRRLMARDWDEEKLISERVFLGTMESFEFNRKKFDCRGTAAPALAVLRVGEGPEILTGRHVFVEKGDLDIVVLLGRRPDLPGEAKKVSWLWHGLTMGDTRLGLSYDFCRAFAVADDLRCDLSLTSVADTWARQRAVRLAREAVRSALEMAAARYRELQADHWSDQDEELEEILLEVLAQRIDIKRNRHRMGSFNDTLLRCRFFQISPPDGNKRRADLFEIWEWIENGRNPALFREESEWSEVESWADRPTVIYGRSRHSRALLQIFGEKAFHRGTAIAQSIEKLVSGGRKFEPPVQPDFQGELEVDGGTLNWALEFSGRLAGLTVLRDGQVYFEDRGLALPRGFHLFGEVPWEPNFGGRLADESLAGRLVEAALRSVATVLDQTKEPPAKKDYLAVTSLMEALGPEMSSWQKSELGDLEWLVIGPALEWMSPNGFARLIKEQSLALYYTTDEQAGARTGVLELPPHLVVSESCLKLLPANFHDVQGVELLAARDPYQLPHDGWISIQVNVGLIARAPDDVTAIKVAFPEDGVSDKDDGTVLEMNLRGHKLQTRNYPSFVGPVVVCLDLVKGWPDSRGRHLVDKEQVEALKSLIPDILTQAGRQLWKSLSAEGLERLHPDVQRTVLIDIWSEGESDFEDRVLTADGKRISLAELRGRKKIRHFDDWGRASQVSPEAVFLTSFQVEALKMTAEVEEFLDELECVPVSPPPQPRPVAGPPGAGTQPEPKTPLEVQPSRRLAGHPEIEAPQTSAQIRNPERSETVSEISSSPDTAPAVSQIEAPPVPTPLLELQGPTLERLAQLLQELQSAESVPFVREFEFFLSGVREVERAETYLRAEEGKPVLRRLENPTKEQLLAVLSALYTFFNRTLEVVEDSHERAFHQALVRHACRR